MKRLIISIPIFVCIAFGACKKVHGPANGKSVQLNNNLDSTVTMNAAINGDLWHTDSAFGYIVKPAGNDSTLQSLSITAEQKLNGNSTTIAFTINTYTGPNTYIINPPFNTATYYVGTERHYATTGQIVIASDTAYALIGTFNFKADGFFIDNGQFNVAKP